MPTTVKYKLWLSAPDITVSKICFNQECKEGPDLLDDLDTETNCFEGTLVGVPCNCLEVDVFIEADGPVGREMKLEASMCENKKLIGQPIKITCKKGACTYSETHSLK